MWKEEKSGIMGTYNNVMMMMIACSAEHNTSCVLLCVGADDMLHWVHLYNNNSMQQSTRLS